MGVVVVGAWWTVAGWGWFGWLRWGWLSGWVGGGDMVGGAAARVGWDVKSATSGVVMLPSGARNTTKAKVLKKVTSHLIILTVFLWFVIAVFF